MLNLWFTPRFATSDALGHEQRLCMFANNPDEMQTPQQSEGEPGSIKNLSSLPLDNITADMRQRLDALGIFQDVGLLRSDAPEEEQRAFIMRHGEVLQAMGTLDVREYQHLQRDEVIRVIDDVRERVLEETSKRPHREIPHVWFNSGDDFEAAYLKHHIGKVEWENKALSVLRNAARRRGMNIDDEPRIFHEKDTATAEAYWRERLMHNDWHDATVEQLRRAAEQRGIVAGPLPTAFQVGTSVYFNSTHPDFEDRDRQERAIAHELAHFVLDTRPKGIVQAVGNYLQKNPERYGQLKENVRIALQQSQEEQGSVSHDELHEIIAIYIAGKRHSFRAGTSHAALCSLMEDAVREEPVLKQMIFALDELGVQWKYGNDAQGLENSIRSQFGTSRVEHASKQELLDVLEGRKEVPHTDIRLHANSDEEVREAEAGLAMALHTHTANPEENSAALSKDLLGRISYNLDLVQEFRKSLPHITEVDGSSLEASTLAFALERLGECGTRLLSLQKQIEKLRGSEEERHEKLKILRRQFTEIEAPLTKLTEVEQARRQGEVKRTVKGPYAKFQEAITLGNRIRWMSVYDIVKVTSVFKEAIVNSYKSQQEVRVYGAARDLAKNFVGSLPFGRPIEQIVLKQARAANDEETSKFADYIKSEGFTYLELLEGPNSALAQNVHNVNRAKAIIEYAADHGWLYKMDKQNGHDVYGVDFEGIFGTHSFLELINRNEGGKEKEVKRGEERVRYHPDIPLIIEDIEDELDKKNIYAVRGMLQILQNKAKLAESNTWGLMTVFDKIKKSSELRSLFEKALLDNIGNIGISQSAWSLTLFKTQRHEFEKWQAVGDVALKRPEFVLARTIQTIQDMIPTSEKEGKKARDLNRIIGRVLAGQTWRCEDGTVISIFLDRFSDYRKHWKAHSSSTEPGKTDDDFFNPDNGGSDLVLLPASSIADILTRQSQGPYVHRTKAHNFLTMILMRADDLERNSPEAHGNFIKEMKEKLNFAWKEVYTQDAACNQLTADKSLNYTSDDARELSNVDQLDEIYQRGLLDQELYYRILVNSKGLKTKKQLEILKNMSKEEMGRYTKGSELKK